jgi:hypothetical protein
MLNAPHTAQLGRRRGFELLSADLTFSTSLQSEYGTGTTRVFWLVQLLRTRHVYQESCSALSASHHVSVCLAQHDWPPAALLPGGP